MNFRFDMESLRAALLSRFAVKVYLTLGALVLTLVLFDAVIMPVYTKGGSVVSVPDVTRKTYEEAEKILNAAGLQAQHGFDRFDDRLPKNTVLSQNPAPELKVKAGRRVYLSINTGERPTATLPDLRGRSLADARVTLDRLKLKAGEIEYSIVSSEEQEGIVQSQSPPKGTRLKEGASVSLTVGKTGADVGGERQSAVPDVTGKTLTEAQRAIAAAGFTTGAVAKQYSRDLIPNTVIEQLPKAGELAPLGKPVDITVSTATKEDEKPNPADTGND